MCGAWCRGGCWTGFSTGGPSPGLRMGRSGWGRAWTMAASVQSGRNRVEMRVPVEPCGRRLALSCVRFWRRPRTGGTFTVFAGTFHGSGRIHRPSRSDVRRLRAVPRSETRTSAGRFHAQSERARARCGRSLSSRMQVCMLPRGMARVSAATRATAHPACSTTVIVVGVDTRRRTLRPSQERPLGFMQTCGT